MALRIHEPEAEMGGGRVIRVSNKDRPATWITFHFNSEHDAVAARVVLGHITDDKVRVCRGFSGLIPTSPSLTRL